MANNYTQATVSPSLPKSLFSDAELQLLVSECGLDWNEHDDQLYFFAGECFSAVGYGDEDAQFDCTALFQEKLEHLDPSDYPCILIEGASTCSKMRPGEFGGFAYFITRKRISYTSTWMWLDRQRNRLADYSGNHHSRETPRSP